jgi:cob(I)alamin adenosyltransferase
MKIYTRTGDSGETGLFGGERRTKDDARVCAYGTVDEANAVLGVAILHTPAPLTPLLTSLQAELFTLGADLATPIALNTSEKPSRIARIETTHLTQLENAIDVHEAELAPLTQFILPGGHPSAAFLHQARTIVRRAEREVVTLLRIEPEATNPNTLIYLNRLSDLLFVLARRANQLSNIPDVPWNP